MIQNEYSRLSAMLSEWLDLYIFERSKQKYRFNGEEKKEFFIKGALARKYKEIKRYLNENFSNDEEIQVYIKTLPQLWILRRRVLGILVIVAWSVIALVNEYVFKFHLGGKVNWRGGEIGILGIIHTVLWFYIYYLMLLWRGRKTDKLIDNLRQINFAIKGKRKKDNLK